MIHNYIFTPIPLYIKSYFFISRVSEWSATDTPATPVDNIQENDFDVWRTMIAMKKVGK